MDGDVINEFSNADLTQRYAQLAAAIQDVRHEVVDPALARFEGMLQALSEAVDQNRREVNAAKACCDQLATQLDHATNRAQFLAEQLQAATAEE